MKAILLIDQQHINPLWFVSRDKTGIKPILTLPQGQVIDDPDCWRLCTIGVASPEDDECRDKVMSFIGNPARLALLQKIRSLIASEGVERLDVKTQRWLNQMKKSYAAELGLSNADLE